MCFSVTYGWSGITVVAPKPVPLPGLIVPLLPFSIGMWLAVCIYMVFATLLLYCLSKTTDRLLGKYNALAQNTNLVRGSDHRGFIHSRKNCCDICASQRTSHALPQSLLPTRAESHTSVYMYLPASIARILIPRDAKRT
jgi:uncharacterized paraquat-inducible protein A